MTGWAEHTLWPAGPLRAWAEDRVLEPLSPSVPGMEEVKEQCGTIWTGVGEGTTETAKRPQSSPTSRAARSLSGTCLLMLPTARTPPSPPPRQAFPGHHRMGPCPGCSSDLHQSAQCQKCCRANRPAQGHQWILLGLQQPGPLVPAPQLCAQP